MSYIMASYRSSGICMKRIVSSHSRNAALTSQKVFKSGDYGTSLYRQAIKRGFSEGKSVEQPPKPEHKTWLQRFLGPKEMPERRTFAWYREMVLICTVFAITGTSTMVVVRPAMSEVLGIKGSLKEGPWTYRIGSIVIMTPLYSALLIVVGTVFGRHTYFRHFAVKMFRRFGIPPELMDSKFHETAKTFKKW